MRESPLDPPAFRPQRLLIVGLAAVGPEDPCGPATPWLHERIRDGTTILLDWPRGIPDTEVLAHTGLAEAMRAGGFEVDRRALLARPRWRSDEAVCRSLARRPRGPAGVTFLELTAPAVAAAAHGPGSIAFKEALRRSEANLRHALETLSVRGDPPGLVLFGWGAHEPVRMVLDLVATLGRRRLRGLRWTVRPELARFECPSPRRERTLRSLFHSTAIADHAVVLDDDVARARGLPVRPGLVHVAPRAGVALRDVAGRVVLGGARGRHAGFVHLAGLDLPGLDAPGAPVDLARVCALLSALRPAETARPPAAPTLRTSATIRDVDEIAAPLTAREDPGLTGRNSAGRSRAEA